MAFARLPMRQRTVIVRDKMQKRLSLRVERRREGRGFDPDSSRELTPAEMLRLGVFGGKYMTDCRTRIPQRVVRARQARRPAGATRALNFFGVDASQPLSEWRRKGWIHPDDPRGWFQWYCRYYWAGACRTRTAGRSRAGKRSAATCGKSRRIASRATCCAGAGKRQALLHWAYDSRKI